MKPIHFLNDVCSDRVSVVIPCYNSVSTLPATFRSVLEQTYSNLEVILVDDGSRDHTLQLLYELKSSHPKWKVEVVSQQNGGVSAARNAGISHSSGEFIAFLDSDDSWFKTKIEAQMKIMQEHRNVSFIGGLHQPSALARKPSRPKEMDQGWRLGFRDFLAKNYVQPSTVMVRRSLLEKTGGFDSSLTHAEEGEFFARLAAISPCLLLDEQLVMYGNGLDVSERGSSLSANLWKMEQGELRNIDIARMRKQISFYESLFLKGFSWIKFARRLVLKALR